MTAGAALSQTHQETALRRLAGKKARRAVWHWAHKWVGLVLGLWFAIIGLTGSILVFHWEIDEWLNADLFHAPPPAPGAAYRPPDEIFAAAKAAMPSGSVVEFANYPRDETSAYRIFVRVPAGQDSRESFDMWHVFVNPYTAGVTGRKLIQAAGDAFPLSFIPFVFSLHYESLLPWEIGGPLVGYVAVAVLVAAVAALVLWWPRRGKWRRAFTVKRSASRERLVFDLHQVPGIYTWIILIALLVSGLYFNLPQTFMSVVHLFSPEAKNRYTVESTPVPGATPISRGQAMAIAEAHTPQGRMDWLYPALKPESAYQVCKGGLRDVSRFVDRRCLVIDQYSGKILYVSDTVSGTNGDAFAAWQWPLHSGQAFGCRGASLSFWPVWPARCSSLPAFSAGWISAGPGGRLPGVKGEKFDDRPPEQGRSMDRHSPARGCTVTGPDKPRGVPWVDGRKGDGLPQQQTSFTNGDDGGKGSFPPPGLAHAPVTWGLLPPQAAIVSCAAPKKGREPFLSR